MVQSSGTARRPLTGRRKALAYPLFALSLASLCAAARPAAADPVLPTGGQSVEGGAKIGSPTNGVLTVNQDSQKAIIDWTSFSIGAGGTVQINNKSGATLNRVVGASISQIDGLLSATGSVYLLNPNGVIIGKSGVVNVGGRFVASTLDLSNQGFKEDHDLTFTGPSTAAVVNLGKIGALGGDVALIATRVDNEGSITAPQGAVGLLAGSQVVIHDRALDDGRYSVLAGGGGTSVTNGGAIAAAEVELRANGGNILALAGNTGSAIKATAINAQDGKILLVAPGGAVTVGGLLQARGLNGGPSHIETSGAQVTIGAAQVDAGQGGSWLVDPTDLVIDQTAANSISTSLTSGTNVNLQTDPGGTGAGNIVIDAPITWSTAAGLNLDASSSVVVDAPITVTGSGQISVATNATGTGGGLVFGVGPSGAVGSLSFSPTGGTQSLSVNGQAYGLIYTASDLENINASPANLAGHWALAQNIDLGSIANFIPIGGNAVNPFTGLFEGFGHTISNLTINYSTAIQQPLLGFVGYGDVGLFGLVGPGGVVQDVNLVNAHVTGADAMQVGALVGVLNGGSLTNASSSGIVTGGSVGASIGAPGIGGLVGSAVGAGTTVSGVSSSATVTGGDGTTVGGLVGSLVNGASLENASASGDVTTGGAAPTQVSAAGGLVGSVFGFQSGGINPLTATVTNGAATGDVHGGGGSFVGGLAGLDMAGLITRSYATGSVTQTLPGQNGFRDIAGGLVGYVGRLGVVTQSYSSGGVVSVAGGPGLGGDVGGLVGAVDPGGSVADAYSTGGISVTGSANAAVGGSVGYDNGSVTRVVASGPVSSTGGGALGGVVGFLDASGSVTNSYWDEGSTGLTNGVCCSNPGGVSSTLVGVGGSTGMNPYAASTYANLDLSGVWFMVDGSTRPFLRMEAASRITNTHQLQLMLLNPAGSYTLASDLSFGPSDFSSGMWNPATGFVPVGGDGLAAFTGSFDGQGHAISGLTIDDTTPHPTSALGYTGAGDVGLFGLAGPGSVIRNITLADAHVTGGDGMAVGALAGATQGVVDNASSSGNVTGGSAAGSNSSPSVGGLVGLVYGSGSSISDSSSSATATGGDGTSVGGLVGGLVNGASVTGSHASGDVTTGSTVVDAAGTHTALAGGLVGSDFGFQFGNVNPVQSTVADSYATGQVSGGGGADLGGFAGVVTEASVSNSYATGSVSQSAGAPAGSFNLAGGFAGVAGIGGSITGSYSTGSVTEAVTGNGTNIVGGFLGDADNGAVVTGSNASGAVTELGGASAGQFNIDGGFVGFVGDSASVSQSFASGSVTDTAAGVGLNLVGGFVGDVDRGGLISQAYAQGPVSAVGASNPNSPSQVGGFAGIITGGGSVSDAYSLSSVTSLGGGGVLLGGFAGQVNAHVTRVYATGLVSGPGAAGGLAGFVGAQGTLTNSYWDEGTTGQTNAICCSASGGVTSGLLGVGGATGVSPYAASTYLNLDLTNVWFMVDGSTRPFLRMEAASKITNIHQLQLMLLNPAGSYTLANDLSFGASDFSSGMWNPATGFVPVGGNGSASFTGSFNGGGHTISGLLIDYTTPHPVTIFGFTGLGDVGLFGAAGPGSEIRNITLADARVSGGDGMSAGALVGFDQGAVANAASSGTVTGATSAGSNSTPAIGGLVGVLGGPGASIVDSSSSADVSGGDGETVGGLVGAILQGSVVTSSSASGDVTTGATLIDAAGAHTAIAGGLVGSDYGFQFGGVDPLPTTVSNSHATGSVTGGEGAQIGGFAGIVILAQIRGSDATGGVEGTTGAVAGGFDIAGGFAGFVGQGASITQSFATGSVAEAAFGAGQNLVGGFVGDVDQGGVITQSYETGAVSTPGGPDGSHVADVGGFAGVVANSAVVSDAFARGSVTTTGGVSLLGGFVGYQNATVTRVYATGPVSGSGAVGALAGLLDSQAVLANAYWDLNSTGQPNGFCCGTGLAANVSGLTTLQLQAALPAGFSPSLWSITPGNYPVLTHTPGP